MKKNSSSHEKVNLFFSAFLIIAYVICGYFFVSFASTQSEPIKSIVMTAVFAIFGLLVFYATRVGEKKIVKRFSLGTLLLLDIPALFIVLALFIEGFPFHEAIAATGNGAVGLMAAVALGYGLPYTFISGFETASEEDLNKTEEKADTDEVLEGGLEADLKDVQSDEEAPETAETEEAVEEIVVEGTAEDNTEE